MKHIILDTGIYRKAPRLDSPEFKSLAYLSRKMCVQVHVPYVVEREFSTQIEHDQKKRLSSAIKSLKGMVSHESLGEKTAELPTIIESLEQNADAIVEERSSAFIAWIEAVGGQRHALTIEESFGALEAYFNGLPPFKEPKVRKDIPDAFIFQCVIYLHGRYQDDLGVIVEDGALLEACKCIGIDVFSSLAEFLASEEAQECLSEKIIDDHIERVLEKVGQVALEYESEIAEAIEAELLRDDFGLLHGESLPGESNEIYVSMVSKPHEVELEDFEHLSAGVFVCNFTAKAEFTYEYAVYIYEAAGLDPDKFYIEPLNDYYVNAETTDEFKFTGRIEFDFGEDILKCTTGTQLLAAISNPSISADEFDDFQLADEDL